jgi:hypothetical protein
MSTSPGGATAKSSAKNGGERGIRTLGTLLRYNALAKHRFRPLSHLTGVEWRLWRSTRTRQRLFGRFMLVVRSFLPAAMAAVLVMALAGCAGREARARKAAAASAGKPRLPEAILVGTVALVDEPGKFVLIDSGRLGGAPTGGILKTWTGGTESGELVISQVRRHPFFIGNIRNGQPRKGDREMLEPALPATAVEHAPATQTSPATGAAQ